MPAANSSDTFTHLSNLEVGGVHGGGTVRTKLTVYDGTVPRGVRVGPSATLPWNGIQGVVLQGDSFDPINSSSFFQYKFKTNKSAWINYTIPHDYVPGTDIHFCLHWLVDGPDTANAVVWQVEYTYTDPQEVGEMDVIGDFFLVVNTSTGERHHMKMETAPIALDAEPEGLLMVRVTRLKNLIKDVKDDVFLLGLTVKYQSTEVGTVSRTHPFYIT